MKSLIKATFKQIETTSGIMHLFRETDKKDVTTEHIQSGTTVAVLSVPIYTTPQDFLRLLGKMRDNISHMRLVSDAVPNKYMILIKFSTIDATKEFYNEFNGKPFSSFEAELCHVVYIKSIIVSSESFSLEFPDDKKHINNSATFSCSKESNRTIIQSNSRDYLGLTDPQSFLNGAVELPTCPVCLERMDTSVTGILTSLCHHTFHCSCIMRWGDTTCPVCRFSSATLQDAPTNENSNECVECQAKDNLWICLICANVGCGRYGQGHASKHYDDTAHVYSLELETQRVWDYAGDGYVHRLIQNKSDGKLVHLSSPNTNINSQQFQNNSRIGLDTLDPSSLVTKNDVVMADKLEGVGHEYAQFVQTQLLNQRHWYDEQLSKMEIRSVNLITRLENELDVVRKDNINFQKQVQESDAVIIKLTKKMEKMVQKWAKQKRHYKKKLQ
ncbi:BRCA1-associated protein 2-domain-containing protein [Globomyces pollinis-pini]|nr:BRCA1-associated protein 2-domain-containing protein [Globomyces pollinis-pini]